MKQNFRTLRQVLAESQVKSGDTWGKWTFIESNLTLFLEGHKRNPGDWYEVDLEGCITSAAVLDWIMQLTTKTWASNDIIADLIRALKDCLRPQANLCGGCVFGGEGRKLSLSKTEDHLEVKS